MDHDAAMNVAFSRQWMEWKAGISTVHAVETDWSIDI
jgi:hypothetical protein